MTCPAVPTRSLLRRLVAAAIAIACALAVAAPSPEAKRARQIIAKSGISGGLVVHLGCGDGRLTAALRDGDSYLVQGLDPDPANIAGARTYIRSAAHYGPVSVDQTTGTALPYIDNLVNLIVVSRDCGIRREEMLRVLAPRGVLWTEEDGKKVTKPVPDDIDDWTHFLHSASNNPVSRDLAVAPPARVQWVGSPLYSRHHDRMSSVSAVVSAKGRVFSIFDEGSRMSILLPPKWSLIARDAFNGTILWRRPIEAWHSHLHGLKSGPASLPRRLVAVDDRVYATLGLDAPVTALDAATGKTLHTYADTERTREIIVSDGTLFVVADPSAGPPVGRKNGWWSEGIRRIVAVDTATGSRLWSTERSVAPITLAVDDARVYFLERGDLVSLDRDTGGESWRTGPVRRAPAFPVQYAPTLLVHDGVVLFAGGEAAAKKNKSWYLEGERRGLGHGIRRGYG